ncbi:transcription factor TFIIIB complex subunit brf1 [Gigaspora margarita]|uniref:B-related factor 1 n=1 Tax=Gigaspora margarita TaxID=4874 RepID=A0A8H4A5I3_GIGMA|nr:transcription factor TFIIIB complex subunit brf1 [Gigaspora margarita]
MSCTHCGENRIEYDSAAGHAFCPKCGYVVEESKIVAEVTFGESASGAAILQGAYVGADQRRARTAGPYRRHSSLDSREQTIANGRRQIQALATALRLSDHLMEAAQRYFNLAITNNFIQGRKTQHVIAACLYIVCRTEKTCHMLIDFSDILQVNVFTLGSTFLKLVNTLHLVLPLIDPSIYITRFASMLEFGEETGRVANDAARLCQRMERDWMQTGRRPAGICGACLLIAARMNNFRRSVKEVIAVVKTADITIKRRIEEFRETPTAKLTVRDFRVVWLEQESDPPSFTRARKAEKNAIDRRQQAASAEDDINDQIQETSSQQDETADKIMQGNNDNDIEADDEVNDESSEIIRQNNDIEEQIDRELEEEMTSYLNDPALKKISSEMEANKKGSDRSDIMDDEEIGSDFDDDEIRNIVLSEEEVKIKTQVWMDMNHEYLKEVEAKRKKQEIDRANGIGVRRHKRPRKGKNDDQTAASTPAEAARRLFEERNLSKKINFKVLDSLFDNITGSSMPNTPTSWRDYDPTSISGSGIARSDTPASSRWEDDEEFGDYYENNEYYSNYGNYSNEDYYDEYSYDY